MTLTGKVVLGIVSLGVLGAGVYFVSERVAKAREIPGQKPSVLPSPKRRDYVGSGWTGWPHKDVFPDVDAIVQALRRLGYSVDDNLLSSRSMDEVGRFQADHNMWKRLWGSPGLGPVDDYPDLGTFYPEKILDEDELVGRDTIEAMYVAMAVEDSVPGGWPALVNWFSSHGG